MKFFGALIILFISLQSLAQAQPQFDLLNQSGVDWSAKNINATVKKQKFARTCQNFASAADYGDWAKQVQKAFDQYAFRELIAGSDDLIHFCPKYTKMNFDEKVDVWTMVLVSISFYESSCRSQVVAKGPNGTLYGLLQLHRGDEGFYSEICRRGDAEKVSSTMSCALSMLDDQLRRDGLLFSQKSYWDVLRPKSVGQQWKKIGSALWAYPECR